MKAAAYPEYVGILHAAQALGRPIKWIEERSEGYVATIHGRDVVQEIELAASADGTITAVRVRLIAAMGAYLQLVTPGIPILGAWLYGGCYAVQGYDFECVGVYTNTTPTDAYRGAGRPEATYAIERAVDALARKLGVDPVELRRKNFIKEFPATIAAGLTIDSGDYEASLDKALEQTVFFYVPFALLFLLVLETEWTRFITALEEHEAGHKDISAKAGREIAPPICQIGNDVSGDLICSERSTVMSMTSPGAPLAEWTRRRSGRR
mgnify:CR=1 FL=1